MRKTIVSVALAVAATLPAASGFWQPRDSGPVHVSRAANCEDSDVQPCITLDDENGRPVWRMVLSYQPYKARNVKACKPVTQRQYPCLTSTRSGALYWHFRNRFLP